MPIIQSGGHDHSDGQCGCPGACPLAAIPLLILPPVYDAAGLTDLLPYPEHHQLWGTGDSAAFPPKTSAHVYSSTLSVSTSRPARGSRLPGTCKYGWHGYGRQTSYGVKVAHPRRGRTIRGPADSRKKSPWLQSCCIATAAPGPCGGPGQRQGHPIADVERRPGQAPKTRPAAQCGLRSRQCRGPWARLPVACEKFVSRCVYTSLTVWATAA